MQTSEKFNRIVAAVSCLFLFVKAGSQTTVQIGTGTNGPIGNTSYSPIYRFSASSSSTNSRSDILFTQAEMAAAGIPAGATITSIQFNKLNSSNFLIPTNFNMFMNNSSNTALDPNVITWTGITSTFTSVYSSSSFNIPSTPGWITWNLQTPFVYTGNALEIATDNNMTGGSAGATGNITWEWTNTTPLTRVVGSTNASPFNTGQDVYKTRPNIKITYYLSSCQTTPVPPVVTNITNTTATIGWSPVSGAQGYQYAITNSSIPPSSGTDVTSNSVNITGLTPLTLYYVHVRTLCSNGYSLFWTSRAFNTLEPCPHPSTPTVAVSNSINKAIVKWNASPFGAFGYQYALTTSATPPSAGIATTDTTFIASGLLGTQQYYVHVRANCNAQGFSSWVTKGFIAPCFIPNPSIVANIKSDAANFGWTKTAGAISYEYAINTVAAPPLSGTVTTDTSYAALGLNEGATYYFHVRSYCGSGVSNWSTLVFNTIGLEAYPNPARNMVIIRMHGASLSTGMLTITDTKGRVVQKIAVTSHVMNVDVSRLAAGMYLVKYTEAGKEYSLNIVKK